jgi:hypothetical protein
VIDTHRGFYVTNSQDFSLSERLPWPFLPAVPLRFQHQERQRSTSLYKSAGIAGCTAVGNIHLTKVEDGVIDLHETRFRNAVVGLGGNSALVTVGALIAPQEGIAHRCPSVRGT